MSDHYADRGQTVPLPGGPTLAVHPFGRPPSSRVPVAQRVVIELVTPFLTGPFVDPGILTSTRRVRSAAPRPLDATISSTSSTRLAPDLTRAPPPSSLPPIRPTPSRARWAAIVLVVLLASGCAPNATGPEWERRVVEAQRLQERGDYDTAEERYRRLLEEAETYRDRGYIRLQLARLAADRGRHETALELYRRVWSGAGSDSISIPARAMFEASELLADRLGDDERARTARLRIVRSFPETTWAERSVEILGAEYAERQDWEGLRRRFEKLYTQTRKTPVAEDLLYEVARTLHVDAADPEGALTYYRRILDDHPDGLLVDDAEWEAARIHLKRQDWSRAIPLLRSLARRVDSSSWVGTFNSPHASKARFRLGILHVTHLGEYREALDQFRLYLADFPNNPRADDALWHMAESYRLLDRPAERESVLRRLIEEYPESRHAGRARTLIRGVDR